MPLCLTTNYNIMKKVTLDANKSVRLVNSYSPEGKEAANSLIDLLSDVINQVNEMADSENEYSKEDIDKVVKELNEKLIQLPELVQNTVAVQLKAVQGVMKKSVSNALKNEAARAILDCKSKLEISNALKAVAVKNGIDTLTFEDVIDYTIVDKFGNENELWNALHKTEITKFFYSTDDMSVKAAIAKKHGTALSAKDVQTLTVTGKTISLGMNYKRQQISVEDMIRLRKSGRESQLITYITEELRRNLTNAEVMAILVGDTVNDAGKKIDTFETIKKVSTDAFTTVVTATGTMPTVAEVRSASDKILNPNGYPVWAIMNKATNTSLANYHYVVGTDVTSDDYYRPNADLAGQLGVDRIYNTDMLTDGEVIIMIPNEYWVYVEGEIEVAYDEWANNAHNMQYERMDGGAIHGLLSTAYIKPTIPEPDPDENPDEEGGGGSDSEA